MFSPYIRLCSHDDGTKKCRLISRPFCIVYTIPVQFKLSAISTGAYTILNQIRHFEYELNSAIEFELVPECN